MLLAAPPPPRSTSRHVPTGLPEAEAARCVPPLLPEAEAALRVVALRCAAHARAPPPRPPPAEALFARELAARETAPAGRTAEQQQQRWSGGRALRQPQPHRPGTSHGGGGTAASPSGGRRHADTKALFARELAARDHAAREVRVRVTSLTLTLTLTQTLIRTLTLSEGGAAGAEAAGGGDAAAVAQAQRCAARRVGAAGGARAGPMVAPLPGRRSRRKTGGTAGGWWHAVLHLNVVRAWLRGKRPECCTSVGMTACGRHALGRWRSGTVGRRPSRAKKTFISQYITTFAKTLNGGGQSESATHALDCANKRARPRERLARARGAQKILRVCRGLHLFYRTHPRSSIHHARRQAARDTH